MLFSPKPNTLVNMKSESVTSCSVFIYPTLDKSPLTYIIILFSRLSLQTLGKLTTGRVQSRAIGKWVGMDIDLQVDEVNVLNQVGVIRTDTCWLVGSMVCCKRWIVFVFETSFVFISWCVSSGIAPEEVCGFRTSLAH